MLRFSGVAFSASACKCVVRMHYPIYQWDRQEKNHVALSWVRLLDNRDRLPQNRLQGPVPQRLFR